jgi:predicted nuclease with TOPRIM domain
MINPVIDRYPASIRVKFLRVALQGYANESVELSKKAAELVAQMEEANSKYAELSVELEQLEKEITAKGNTAAA